MSVTHAPKIPVPRRPPRFSTELTQIYSVRCQRGESPLAAQAGTPVFQENARRLDFIVFD